MARTKPLPCGHGSRHLSPYDGRCRRCVREFRADPDHHDFPQVVGPITKAKVHQHDAS